MTNPYKQALKILEDKIKDEIKDEMEDGDKSFQQLLKEFLIEFVRPFESGEQENILAYQQTQEWKDSLLR